MAAPLTLASLNNPQCRPFVDAWLRWRGEALVPNRANLELNEIKRDLPMVSLLELKGPDEIRVRVSGTGLTPFKGFDLTGRNLADLTPRADWPVRRYRMFSLVRHPCGGALFNEARQDDGTLLHSVVILTLPMLPADPAGDPLVLLLTVRTDQPGTAPHEPYGRMLPMPDEFSFVDIGAGTPASIMPPPS